MQTTLEDAGRAGLRRAPESAVGPRARTLRGPMTKASEVT